MPVEAPLRARGLVKRYGEIAAVTNVDLTVDAGEVYGFLGPNGAGKTTTLRMALGLIRPTAGSVELFGRDPMLVGAGALEGVAGFVEEPRFYPYLSGARNLELLAALDGGQAHARIPEALAVVDLSDRARDRVGGYSHGMRQRLGIAASLLRAPRLLILDEPTNGLDPAGIRDMRVLIGRLAGEGMTVLLSSHQLAEVQEICGRVAIIRSGQIAYEGPLTELGSGPAEYELRTSDDRRALAIVRTADGITDASGSSEASGPGEASPGSTEIRFQAQETDVGRLSLALAAAGIEIFSLHAHAGSLEELFFSLTEDA